MSAVIDVGGCGDEARRRSDDRLWQRAGLQPQTQWLDDEGVVLDAELAVGSGDVACEDDGDPGALSRDIEEAFQVVVRTGLGVDQDDGRWHAVAVARESSVVRGLHPAGGE